MTGREESAPLRFRGRARQALAEFLRLPLAVVGGWLAVAALTICVDRGVLPGGPVTRFLAGVVPPGSSGMLLQYIVTGLMTLNSIVFFVLIMAVQHQSSNYSPIVFDQFLRRGSNQLFFGVLIGEAVYSVLTVAMVPSGQTVLSGTVALAAVAATLIALLAFVYSTIDQMRPSTIVWMIQHLALDARARQQPLQARCRLRPQLVDVPVHPVRADRPGYIVHIALDWLAGQLRGLDDVEIEFQLAMGDHLVPGTLIANIRGGDDNETRERLAQTTLAAILLGQTPDVDHDAGHAVDHIGNMAWAAASTNDPEGARVATRALHSLLAHWGGQDEPDPNPFGGDVAIVYRDRAVTKVLDSLTSVIVAACNTGQHQTVGYALEALAEAMPRLATGDQRTTLDRLHRVLPGVPHHMFTPHIDAALAKVHDALDATGLVEDRDHIAQTRHDLRSRHHVPPNAGHNEVAHALDHHNDNRRTTNP